MITIVLATYNREDTLPKSLRSVLKQTHQDIEVLVVDDGSTDGTEQLMKAITDPRVRYIKLSNNSGASMVRNRGIQEARGDYILVWDSDDELYPYALEKIISTFKQQPTVSIVSAPARILIGGKEKTYPHFSTGEVMLADILCKKLPSNEKVRVARTNVMKQISYKSRNIDFLVNVELIERGKWYHLDEMLADVHNSPNEGSLTSSRKKKNAQYAIERASHLVGFLERHGAYLKAISAPRYADYCYGTAMGLLLAGDVKRARCYAHDAAHYHIKMVPYWVLYILSCIPCGSRLLRALY
ncbi:MAG: glycosyltransferase [Candidatus Campbellbacteria bacterium]|nr:glycosyltransferase [Candidatus Campbellbacteria bacterium]